MAMNEYSLADIAAVADGAGGNRGNGGGWGNGDGWWVLILIALLGGFNGGFGGWGGWRRLCWRQRAVPVAQPVAERQ